MLTNVIYHVAGLLASQRQNRLSRHRKSDIVLGRSKHG